jgi:hypothetical protein
MTKVNAPGEGEDEYRTTMEGGGGGGIAKQVNLGDIRFPHSD